MSNSAPLVVLALDLAKNRSGWAVGSPGWKRPFWGIFELAGEWDRHEGKRLHDFREFLARKCSEHSVTYIAIERFFINIKDFDFAGTTPIAQMHGIAMEYAHSQGIRCGSVAIGSWRSHFLGTSVAPKHLASKQRTAFWKEMAVKACVARNLYVTFHDEAEAIGIMDYALSCLDADYDHKTGPASRRAALKAETAAFRGESPL